MPESTLKSNSGVTDITPLSLLDFPGELSAIFWFPDCNLHCAYCYNPHFVRPNPYRTFISMEALDAFLEERARFIDGVVLSGGECTLSPQFENVCERITRQKLKIKIDTNGTSPHILESLIQKKQVHFVALDFKSPPEKIQLFTEDLNYFARWEQTLRLLLKHPEITLEVRTTFHPNLLKEDDILKMAHMLVQFGYRGTYYIQNFFHGVETLSLPPEKVRAFDLTAHDFPLTIKVR